MDNIVLTPEQSRELARYVYGKHIYGDELDKLIKQVASHGIDSLRKYDNDISNILVIVKGGPGSGHHGHSGVPGKRGGSLPGSGSGGSASFDEDSKTLELRDAYEVIYLSDSNLGSKFSDWTASWNEHVRNYVVDTLRTGDLTVYRSQNVTGISNEGYGNAFFTSLSKLIASEYAKGYDISEFKIPKGSRLYDEGIQGVTRDVEKLHKAGYSGILRASMGEVILFDVK